MAVTDVLLLDPLPGDLLPPCVAAGMRFVAAPPAALALAVGRSPAGGLPTLRLVRGGPAAIVAALEAGAADAEALDADPALIAARLRALAARVTLRTVGPLALDLAARTALRDGRPLDLLPREFALLACLAERAGAVVSRAGLLQSIWGLRHDPGTNRVAVHVSRLRARLDRGADWPMLLTVAGAGYRLRARPDG